MFFKTIITIATASRESIHTEEAKTAGRASRCRFRGGHLLHDRRILFRYLLYTCISGFVANAGAFVCGQPGISANDPPALYLWQDCQSQRWTLQAWGGDDYADYTGTIFSDTNLNNIREKNIGLSDSVQTAPTSINFLIRVWNSSVNEVSFDIQSGGRLYLDIIDSSGKPVYLGKNKTIATDFPARVGNNGKQFNIVFVLTDDQRFDTLWSMPILQSDLVSRGVDFQEAIVTSPLCCPARASILSGGLLDKNTGVYTNKLPTGTFQLFHDAQNLGTALQQAGYRTGLVGKVMNGYPTGYVMPGWDTMVANLGPARDDWNSYSVTVGSSRSQAAVGTVVGPINQYITDYQRDRVVEFINQNDSRPFFIMLSTYAPHGPATAAPGDGGLFAGYTWRGRGVTETDLTDKPEWIWNPNLIQSAKTPEPQFPGQQLASLQAVDRAVGAIVDALETSGKIADTVIVFTSDNGYLWGEHGIWRKPHEFEEALRVPLVVRMPGISPRVDLHQVAADIDLPAFFLDLANSGFRTDGRSLFPLLIDPATSWRNHLLVNLYTHQNARRSWVGVRTTNWKFIENMFGDRMLYDLANDPFELENLAGDPQYANIEATLKQLTDAEKGAVISRLGLPNPQLGNRYSEAIDTIGGTPPYRWKVVDRTPNVFIGRQKWKLDADDLPINIGAAKTLCGTPSIVRNGNSQFYAWRDCNTNFWHFRAIGGTGTTHFYGLVVTDAPLVSLTGVLLEQGDTVQQSGATLFNFGLHIWDMRQDGFDVELQPDTGMSLILSGNTKPEFKLGASPLAITATNAPIRLDPDIACGQPFVDPDTEPGIFIWKDCATGPWKVRVFGGGDFQEISGRITGQAPPTIQQTYHLNGSDVLKSRNGEIVFDIKVWGSSENGFDFSIPGSASATLDIDMHDLPSGLALDSSTGLISGIPDTIQTRSVQIKVVDQSARKIDGNPQAFNVIYELDVQP